jgi:cyclopropane fatty-acyl-phospholipid synthase-like methyltransferase
VSDKQWKMWGKQDPYYGVYSEDRFSKETIDNHRDEFFATGQRTVEALLNRATRMLGSFKTMSALEFGSGVGRMTIPLARRFDHVVGVELSSDMIAEAEHNCSLANITNAKFVTSDDALSKVQGSFDLVLSYIVLQHITPDRGMVLMDGLLNFVAPGGVAILQASVRRPERSAFAKMKYRVRHRLPWLAASINLLRGRKWSTLTMKMSEYDPIEILLLYKKHQMGDVILTEHYQADVLTYHFAARKAL